MKESISKVTFEYLAEALGDIRISGNTENTGNWDPENSVRLIESDGAYTLTLIFPYNTTFEYKYLAYSNTVVWETLPNRKLYCNSSEIHIKDCYNSPISKISIHPDYHKLTVPEQLPVIKDNIKFTINDSIMFANFNLPIKVSYNPNFTENSNEKKWKIELNKGIWLPVFFELSNENKINILYIGWPGIIIEKEEEQKELTEILLNEYKCYPVFISETLLNLFNTFCNNIIWPIFNNIIHMKPEEIPQYSLEQWEVYKSVNSIFSEAIMINYTNQLIWVNDYGLMLTPNFVSRRIHDLLNIGFYLYSAFPSADVFKILPHGEAILHSILACDLISFQSYEYASDFLKTCKLLIGIDHHFSRDGYLLLEYFGRHIMLRVREVCIEVEVIKKVTQSPEFFSLTQSLKNKYKGYKVLLGVDNMHELSGILLKLNAFKKFLETSGKDFVLLQYLTKPKITNGKECNMNKYKILEAQDEINAKVGRKAVELVFEDLSNIQRYALMSLSWAFFNCCLKDSTCLTLYEYLIVNEGSNKPVIVSEMAGISRSLRSFIKINPYGSNNVYEALLDLTNNYNIQWRSHDIRWIYNNSIKKWAICFLNDLKKAQKNPKLMQYMKYGMGDKMKLVALRKNFSKLDPDSLLITYKRSGYRALFFDNEGTLVEHMKLQKKSAPKTQLLSILSDLAKDPQNVIFVITGREKKVLDTTYNVPYLGLAAEYGAFIKWSSEQDWESRYSTNELWKDTAKQIIEIYVSRAEGAYIEEKECSVVFQYKDCDFDYGNWQAKELVSQLEDFLNPYVDDCEIVEGTGYVEVKPRHINKGVTIEYLVNTCYNVGIVFDFVLVVGDDLSDEEMFKSLKKICINKNPGISTHARCFSCTLGRKPTEADYYLNDPSEILHCLDILRNWTIKNQKYDEKVNSIKFAVDILLSRRSSEDASNRLYS
jgi:trehalose 6-phosphate synthase/phosphatase